MTANQAPGQSLSLNAETLQALIDHMPVSVMIHHPQTLEVLYANDSALASFRVDDIHGINQGFIFNPDAFGEPPCSWDDMRTWFARAAEQGPQRFLWSTPLSDGSLLWEDVFLEPITLDGRLYISSTAADVTAKITAEQRVKARLQLERLVSQISRHLLTRAPAETQKSITDVLGLLGEHLRADRAYVFLYNPGNETLRNSHEWCAPGIAPQQQDLQTLPVEYQSDWLEALQGDHRVVVDQLASQTLTPQLTAIMEAGGIHSILLVPIIQDGQFTGFMGFDAVRQARQWPEDDIAMVQVVAGLVASALTRESLVDALTYEAHHDSLTGLWNRRYLEGHIRQNIQRVHRYGTHFAVVLFDVDYFKRVNDRHGHNVGDEVLREVARLLWGATRKSDILARWGGEEFLVLLPETDAGGAQAFAEGLRAQIESYPFVIPEGLTISVGVTVMEADDSFASLLKRADAALYQAKEHGRNQVVSVGLGD
ncbi:sensor domain-containing diguanylate cyclase [Marinimicrobium alkaliphilum]|uniref:sensor domain-containing diguanylate cyclase n=1 Tax=Marinimicrobium alkaliphilum TaxID=2202654 RepID=UPI000DB98EC4|nr:diguanylate cyclase [Marinimicrobium alkaliphilum]